MQTVDMNVLLQMIGEQQVEIRMLRLALKERDQAHPQMKVPEESASE